MPVVSGFAVRLMATTIMRRLEDLDDDEVSATFARLEEAGRAELEREGLGGETVEFLRQIPGPEAAPADGASGEAPREGAATDAAKSDPAAEAARAERREKRRKLKEAEAAAALPVHGLADTALFTVHHLLQARQAVGDGVFAHLDADPATTHFVRHRRCGAGAKEAVEDEVAGVGGDVDYSIYKSFRLWC